MISIIICSINQEDLDALKKNIESSIGVPYEIIGIDNRKENNSICSVYNKGSREAKYEIVCLLHEDILFRTNNWGQIIINAFAEKEVGLLGVAGSYYYSLPPISWFSTDEKEVNVIHTPEPGKILPNLLLDTRFPEKDITEVVAIDGVFMVTRKEILKTVSFDEALLDNFHGYDIDLSLQVLQTHKIAVTKKILIEHFSKSSLDQKWFDAIFKLSKKWKKKLPVYVSIYSKTEIKKMNQESVWDFYFLSTPYLTKRKRIRLYFYYAIKLAILPSLIKRIAHHYFQRFIKNK